METDDFKTNFTTQDKITADKLLPAKEQTGEISKTILSNDAFAIGELLSKILIKMEQMRISSNK